MKLLDRIKLFVSGLFVCLIIITSVPSADAQDAEVFDTGDLRTVLFEGLDSDYIELSLTIEPEDVSVLFYVKSDDPSVNIALTGIYDENDNVIFELSMEDPDAAGGGFFGFPPITESGGGELAVFLPGSPDFDLRRGEYWFVFESDGGPLTEGFAIIRSGNVDHTQAIDINFWIASPASQLEQPEAQQSFERSIRVALDDLLMPHNLRVGRIDFFVSSEEAIDAFALTEITEGDESAIGDICLALLAQVGARRALNVAIIDEFLPEAEDNGETTGIAYTAGNAGVIASAESPYSCVVVTWNAYPTSFADQAANIIHEGSHFMSLPHTTEEDGLTFDLFSDTPECYVDEFDLNEDAIVDELECDLEGGAKNYMFWNGSEDFAPFEMSMQQAWMLRRHPLFYPVNS